MSTLLPFGSNTIPTFLYEPFSYTISNPAPGTYTLTTSNTPGIPSGYLVNNSSNVVFATSSNGMNTGTEVFTVTARDASGTTIATSSNTVTISAGRFRDASGNGYAGSNYVFYKNEPITPVRLVAPFAIATPTSVPTLPPGLSYSTVSTSTYDITGTPLVTVPQSNYLIIGKATGSNTGKIVTSQIGMVVSNERILLNLSGTPIVSPMTVDTPIATRVLTARYPPYPSGGTLRYSWSTLPDGIVVKDLSGNTQPGTIFTPVDASSTLVITGTPTITAANTFRDANISSNVISFTATRTNPLPTLSNVQPITFGFGETVLFDTPSIPTFYSGVTLDPSATFFRAQTYFGTGAAITSISSPNLRSDLSLNFVSAQGRAYLTGTPSTTTGTASYTIRAINANAVSRDLSASITVAADVVSFISPPTPAVDICYNFVLSRPLTLDLSGYYPSNIQFQATAASGKLINFSAPALAGTGISLSNVSANVVQLSGIPDTITPLTTVTVTADASGTPATASRTFKLAVVNDTITISDISSSSLVFVQNRAITPIQLSASTLSGRPVTSFTSANLPTGITLSTTGLLAGTPTFGEPSGNTFTVTASTGFASQTKTYSYRTIDDNILIVLPTTTATVSPVFSNVEFDVLTYSGTSGSLTQGYFGPTGVQPKQSTTATLSVTPPVFLGGDFSIVPVLAPEYRFFVQGEAGVSGLAQKQVNVTVGNAPTIQHSAIFDTSYSLFQVLNPAATPPFVSGQIAVSTESPITFPFLTSTQVNATRPAIWTTTYTFSLIDGTGFDMARNSNVFVAVFGSNIIRSTDYGNTWSNIPSSNIQTLPGYYGPQWLGYPQTPPPPAPQLGRARFDNPLFGAVVSDGTSNWYALGQATYDVMPPPPAVEEAWVQNTIIRKSSDNGITWTDVAAKLDASGLPTFNTQPATPQNRLYYNQGRLFYTSGAIPSGGWGLSSNLFFYADVSDLTTWTSPIDLGGGYIRAVAFSNSTVLGVGTRGDTGLQKIYRSTNNGTSWVLGVGPFDVLGNGYSDAFQKYGLWMVSGNSNGFQALYYSSNLTSWASLLAGNPGGFDAITENGITWVTTGNSTLGRSDVQSVLWQSSNLLQSGQNFLANIVFGSGFFGNKRLYSDVIATPSNPTLTFSIPYDSSGIVFTRPTQTQYTNWQFVPIPTIPLVASNPVPGNFLYYYASGLPRGLTLNLDSSGVLASVTGTSSQFSDAFQRVIFYAALNPGGGGGGVAAFPITMRTLLPTVQKQQTSAGAWTSLVRQYTLVNAAENSINGRVLPATEPPLGEFTRPYPPDEVSAPGDPNCQKC